MKKALIVQGGWQGHEPKEVADILADALREQDFEVEVSDTLDALKDLEKLKALDLIVPEWTMGKIEKEQVQPLLEAVKGGTALGGVHGGMCDAFREATEYQFMCGGQWVAHPGGGGVTYTVNICKDNPHPITEGVEDFEVTSEQYYLHVDPGNNVLATTNFGDVVMPVAWTKMYGEGRVYYCSVGHNAEATRVPMALKLITQGLVWAAGG